MTDSTDTPLYREWWQHTFGSWLNVLRYLRERKSVLTDPNKVVSSEPGALETGPFLFALQSVFFVPLLTSVFNWILTFTYEIPPDIVDMLQQQSGDPTGEWPADYEPLFGIESGESRYEMVKAGKRASEITQSLAPIVVSLSILMAASLFKVFLRRWRDISPLVSKADRVYAYCVGARLFYPVMLFGLFTYLVDLEGRYRLFVGASNFDAGTVSGMFESMSPIHQIIFVGWYAVRIGLAIWIIVALWKSAAVMTHVLQLKETTTDSFLSSTTSVAIRLLGAQLVTLLAASLAYISIFIGYYALHV